MGVDQVTFLRVTQVSKVVLFNNLVLLASSDGKFSEEEVLFLVNKAEAWDISADEVECALAGASTGEGEIVLPVEANDKRELLAEMVRLMAVDGNLSEVEKRLCATASAAMDFSVGEFDEILQSVLSP
ncbi:hypothetical protein OAF34_02540 [Pirellulaceae bacterium]|jgi:hypothetical protein|nr:hypothetical protein [Pirellulaceae bacterium]